MLSQRAFRVSIRAACLLCGFLAASIPAAASPISLLVVFGDSLSDNGNAAIALGGALPGNYAPNALTDGPATTPATAGPFGLWIDQLAPRLGVADPLPFLAGGTNYAVATALTGHNPAFSVPPLPPTAVPYVTDQVALYLLGNTPSPGVLYTFWAGANDIFAGGNPVTAADSIAANIQTLAAFGATDFLWLNMPPLGDTPRGVASGFSAALNAASSAFDAEWSTDIAILQAAGIGVHGVDVDQLFDQITGAPSLFGFTDVTNPAWCGPGGLPFPACAANNPNHFLYWDGEHPTTAAHALIADRAADELIPTPEPASMFLLGTGLVVVARKRLF